MPTCFRSGKGKDAMNKTKMLKLAQAIVKEITEDDISGVQIRQVPPENKLVMGDTLTVTVTFKPEHVDYLQDDHETSNTYYQ